MKRNAAEYIAGILAAVVALVVYAMTLSRGAFPGESAYLLCERMGLSPQMSPGHPLYYLLSGLLSYGSVVGAISRLNWMSAVCGALCVWLLYEILYVSLRACVDEEDQDTGAARAAAVVGGIVGGLALAFSVPFWTLCTRAHFASLDMLWLLAAARLLLLYMRSRMAWVALLLVFLYGVGIAESATFIVFAPVVGVSLLYMMWQRNHLRAWIVVCLLLCLLAGLSLYAVAVWRFTGSSGYVVRGYTSGFHVFQVLLRDQYHLLSHSLPARGGLIIVIVTIVPWVTGLLVARRGLNGERDWTYYVLHAVMTGLFIAVLLNTRIAPCRVAGAKGLITPYVLNAALAGYLAAYWMRLPSAWWRERQEGIREWARLALGPLFVLPVLACVAWAPVLNFRACDGKGASLLNLFAADVAEELRGTEWLVSDGAFDDHLLLAAKAKGIPLRIINAQASRSSVYMKFVSMQFSDPRLRNLSEIGLLPMLEEWFRTDAGITGKVAVVSVPELWESTGYCAVPCKTFFRGTLASSLPDAASVMNQHREFWGRQLPRVRAMAMESGEVGAIGQRLRRYLGFEANNLGVWLEDRGDPANAFAAYEQARAIDPENISAVLNMDVMVRNGRASGDTNELRQAIAERLAKKENQPRLWALARYYGYIRAPLAYAESGWNWAISGQRSAAVLGLKKAMELASETRQDDLKQILADVYMMQEEGAKSESLYREVLTENPKNVGALVGLGRAEARKRNFGEAEALFRQAGEAGAAGPVVELDLAMLEHAQGRSKEARQRIEAVVDKQPEFLRAWVLLTTVVIDLNDDEAMQNCLGRIQALKGGAGYAAALRADLALRQNDFVSARSALEQAVSAMPTSVRPLELLLRLDVMQRRQDQAALHARRLLGLDVQNAFGNYVVGSLHISEGNYELAEDSLRTSLKARRSALALNDLAWLLQEKKQYGDAEELAREVLALDATTYQAWDTLGVVMMRTGRLEPAASALEKALSIAQSDPVVFLHMAELYSVRGEREKSRQLLQVLYGKVNQLSAPDQEKLNAISRSLDAARQPGAL